MNPSNNPFREIIFSFRFFLSEKKKEEEVLELLLEVVVEEENEEEGEKWEGERKASIWNEEEEEEEEDNEKGLRQETRKTKIVKRKIVNRIVGLYRFLSLWPLEFSSSFSKKEEDFLFPDLSRISSWGILSLSLSQAK